MRVRLSDVAEAAGVSLATVSRVLGGRSQVAPETKKRVEQALDRLGYQRSTLLAPSAPLIGVCSPEDPEEWQLAVCRRVSIILQRRGMLVASPGLFSDGSAIIATIQAGAAALVTPVFTPVRLSDRLEGGSERVPMVRLAETLSDPRHSGHGRRGNLAAQVPVVAKDGIDHVAARVDLTAGLRAAFGHLTSLGHRRIGLICNDRGQLAEDLKSRFIDGHPARSVRPDLEQWIASVPKSVSGGELAALRLLDATCTAVIVQSAKQVHGVFAVLRRNRLSVPRDLSVVAVGDSPTMQYMSPSVSVISLQVAAITDALLAGLSEVLGGSGSGASVFDVPPVTTPELVARASTAAIT